MTADTRWARDLVLSSTGTTEGEYGVAEQLSKAKNTSVDGLVRAGIIESRRGARSGSSSRPNSIPRAGIRDTDSRLTVWEITHHLIRLLEFRWRARRLPSSRRSSAAKPRPRATSAYRLYVVSERKRRAADALAYNGLVQSWPEIVRIAGEQRATTATQGALAIDGA